MRTAAEMRARLSVTFAGEEGIDAVCARSYSTASVI
jgi:hypothetical protein